MNIIETNLKFKSLSTRRSTKRIIIHHAAAKKCSAQDIHRWHLDRGWSGAGYHFLVRKDGKIYRLRPEKCVGSHASGNNSDSIGICFEGDFEKESMGKAQKESGKQLVGHIKSKYGISKVQRHRDVGSTSCPGKNFPFSEIAGGTYSGGVTSSGGSSSSSGGGKEPALGMGDRGSDVKELQKMLIACGYSCGSAGADGIFGSGTKNAVIKFQKAHDLSVDGLAGKRTMAKLKSVYSSNKKPSSGSSSTSKNWISRLQTECNRQGFSNQKVDGIAGKNTLAGCPTCRKGAKGNITKLIQERLISLGFSCGSTGADGVFGNGTKNAVIKFQKSRGLSADGIVGKNTWRKLLGM